MNKLRIMVGMALVVFSGLRLVASQEEYPIQLQQTGAQAKKIYEAMQVPEEAETVDFQNNTTSPRTTITKIGKHLMCIKVRRKVSKNKNQDSYTCTSGFNSAGASQSSQ